MLHIHAHAYKNTGILFSHKKKKIQLLMEAGRNLKSIRLNVISQTQKDKYCMISVYGIKKKKKSPEAKSGMTIIRQWGCGEQGDVDQRV